MSDEVVSSHSAIVLGGAAETATYGDGDMDLFLVRHGQPDWAPNRIARNDPSLTELGQEQALRVGHRLASLPGVDELWVSPMHRAVETSSPIAENLTMGSEVYDWLKEIQNPSEWEGEPVEEVERALREANLRTMDEMWDGLPGGETFRTFHERVVDGLNQTLESHGVHSDIHDERHLWEVDDPDRRVVIVAHAGTNAVILGHLLGLDPVPWEWDRFRQPHTGVSRVTTIRVSTGWAFSLRQLGDVTHLHPGMVTA